MEGKLQPTFVRKLYRILEDQESQPLISWSKRGDVFYVTNPASFSKTVLPLYFKHNNWQSFIRQLNMYGFNKINDMTQTQTWEFKHPKFKRGEEDELDQIKRKINTKSNLDQEEDGGLLHHHISLVEEKLACISEAYDVLRKETHSLKAMILQQQETIQKFTSLFADVVCDKNMSDEKREFVLFQLNQFQTAFETSHERESSFGKVSSLLNPEE
ncbi:HSF-type DNA-binding-domain-containing protein [Sporodiniella umbellata]|nr:HSF-type DNA-binding-domain-containing protein [Sporodiniella umbellata]